MNQPRKQANPVTEFLRGKKFQLTGYLFYPHLTQPKQEPNKAPKYSCMIAWDLSQNQQTVQQILELMRQVKGQFHPNVLEHAWVNPVKDFRTTKRNDGSNHPKYLEGKQWLNASNTLKFAPQLLMADPQAPNGMRAVGEMDKMQFYDGQKIAVSISFFGLHGENAKYGVSTNIDAVVIIGGGERIMTEAGGVDVAQAFGQFLGQMGQQQQAPQTQQQNYQQGQQQQVYNQQNQGQVNHQAQQNQQQQQNNYYQQGQQQQHQGNYQQPMTAHDPRTQNYNQQQGQQFAQGPGYNGNNGGYNGQGNGGGGLV